MVIDKKPIVNVPERSFEVVHNVDINEEISISMNGVIAFLREDIDNIQNNKIYLYNNIDIDYYEDYVIFYTKVKL